MCGAWRLATYRLLHVADGGRLRLGDGFQSTGDVAAMHHAGDLLKGAAAELWEGGRLVGYFAKGGAFTLASDRR